MNTFSLLDKQKHFQLVNLLFLQFYDSKWLIAKSKINKQTYD